MASTYNAAKEVAPLIQNHFRKIIFDAKQRGEKAIAPEPGVEHIEEIIDAAFWTSIQREEGHPPNISLAFFPPDMSAQPLQLERHLPVNSNILTKLSPGIDKPGVHLGIWHENNELYVWGTTSSIPNYCFIMEVSEPGLLVVKHRRTSGIGKYNNVAVFVGDKVKIIDGSGFEFPDQNPASNTLLDLTSSYFDNSFNVLVQLSVSMRAHKRGGIILVVPAMSNNWKDSIRLPARYSINPHFSGIFDLLKKEEDSADANQWQKDLYQEIDTIGGLTAIDGATVIDGQYKLLAFGTKIKAKEGNELIDKILITEPVVGNKPYVAHPALFGGTRHLSAAQFVFDQKDAHALVASQDGPFTIFSWSLSEEIVQAYRIETLLL